MSTALVEAKRVNPVKARRQKLARAKAKPPVFREPIDAEFQDVEPYGFPEPMRKARPTPARETIKAAPGQRVKIVEETITRVVTEVEDKGSPSFSMKSAEPFISMVVRIFCGCVLLLMAVGAGVMSLVTTFTAEHTLLPMVWVAVALIAGGTGVSLLKRWAH